MNNAIEIMLEKYKPNNIDEKENAIKEIIQEITLAGLSRGGFFEKAAFYGGTCLRIFYGLNRFSEDLGFALLQKDESFRLEDYFSFIKNEFLSYGIEVNIEAKNKSIETDVQSAFIKSNTQILMMTFFPRSDDAKHVISNQKIKIKFAIDVDNPEGGISEFKYRMLPTPYEVRVFDEATLFAGKICAIICREYKNHVKGRDYYDYLFYIGKGSHININYLENKLKKNLNRLTTNLLKKM